MVHKIAFVLLVVGGVNWLLVAFNANLVEMILGTGTLAKAVYILVGLSAVYLVVTHRKHCTACTTGGSGGM